MNDLQKGSPTVLLMLLLLLRAVSSGVSRGGLVRLVADPDGPVGRPRDVERVGLEQEVEDVRVCAARDESRGYHRLGAEEPAPLGGHATGKDHGRGTIVVVSRHSLGVFVSKYLTNQDAQNPAYVATDLYLPK